MVADRPAARRDRDLAGAVQGQRAAERVAVDRELDRAGRDAGAGQDRGHGGRDRDELGGVRRVVVARQGCRGLRLVDLVADGRRREAGGEVRVAAVGGGDRLQADRHRDERARAVARGIEREHGAAGAARDRDRAGRVAAELRLDVDRDRVALAGDGRGAEVGRDRCDRAGLEDLERGRFDVAVVVGIARERHRGTGGAGVRVVRVDDVRGEVLVQAADAEHRGGAGLLRRTVVDDVLAGQIDRAVGLEDLEVDAVGAEAVVVVTDEGRGGGVLAGVGRGVLGIEEVDRPVAAVVDDIDRGAFAVAAVARPRGRAAVREGVVGERRAGAVDGRRRGHDRDLERREPYWV